MSFTYGYIREATMAHLDLDETEAQAIGLLARFHIYANEAMQAICSSKPMYKYRELEVVAKYVPLVRDGNTVRPATKQELEWNEEEQGPLDVDFLNKVQLQDYYHDQNIYEVGETVSMEDTFIAFADKQAWREFEAKPTPQEIFEYEAFGNPRYAPKPRYCRERVQVDYDLSYVGRNKIKFYKPGKYKIPGKYMWFRFDSGISDDTPIDMPSDILLTIPLYIAAICFQIDNPQRANLVRNEFELALSRCTATDFMELIEIKSSW